MKKMNAPMMETVRFDAEDVIATSGLLAMPTSTPGSTSDYRMYIAGVNGTTVTYYYWEGGKADSQGVQMEKETFQWTIDNGGAGIQAGQWYVGQPNTWHLYTPTN